ncbi:replication initiator protein A [Gluconacetobacter asukensis]|uniref:Replication protein A n=1 Tax=Gluconacetobacter asukensis TaxID=1017181 RepID=A0A7W4J2R7_9PROT|nr:replication initiator protein A [Gluconacetobacter asukensis]MBB2173641.1 replication protein A [Gluconacetobacter asukensis]
MMPAADSWRQSDRRFVVTGSARPRDIRDLMDRPFFALGKTPRQEPIHHRCGYSEVHVVSSGDGGLATLMDADVLLWLAGQLRGALNEGQWISRHVRFTPWQLFQDLGWDAGAHQYRRLRGALARLAATTVVTNIRNGLDWRDRPFAWVSDVRISRNVGVALTLPDWFLAAVSEPTRVLTVHPTYFHMGSGIGRWLYRFVRRRVGRQKGRWLFDFTELHGRSGTLMQRYDFVLALGKIVRAQSLPGYHLSTCLRHGTDYLRIQATTPSTGSVEKPVESLVATTVEKHVGTDTVVSLGRSKNHYVNHCSRRKYESRNFLTYKYNTLCSSSGGIFRDNSDPAGQVKKEAREAVVDRGAGVP